MQNGGQSGNEFCSNHKTDADSGLTEDDDDTDDTELITLITGQCRRHCKQFSG